VGIENPKGEKANHLGNKRNGTRRHPYWGRGDFENEDGINRSSKIERRWIDQDKVVMLFLLRVRTARRGEGV